MAEDDDRSVDRTERRRSAIDERISQLMRGRTSIKQVCADLNLSEEVVLKLLDNAVLTSRKFDEFNLAMFPLDRGRVLDHPHLHDMDEVGLLAHLRSRHGHERPADFSLDDLRELHERLHREPPPSPA